MQIHMDVLILAITQSHHKRVWPIWLTTDWIGSGSWITGDTLFA